MKTDDRRYSSEIPKQREAYGIEKAKRKKAEEELLRIKRDLDTYRDYVYPSDHSPSPTSWGTPRHQTEETKMSNEIKPMAQADQWFLGFVLAIVLAALTGLGIWFYYEPMALVVVACGAATILGIFLLGKVAYFIDLADQKRKIKKGQR